MLNIILALLGGFCLVAVVLSISVFANSKDTIEDGKVLKEKRK